MSDKYCKDCVHKRIGDVCQSDKLWKQVGAFNLVRGHYVTTERTGLPFDCLMLRETPEGCGPEGKWFEPIVPPEVKRPKPRWRLWK